MLSLQFSVAAAAAIGRKEFSETPRGTSKLAIRDAYGK